MTLRSAARPRRALARHWAGTYISSGTLKSHLYFTSITLVIHFFLSNSHTVHLWVTWSAKCPVASFYEALTNSLVSRKGFSFLVPMISFQCLSFPSMDPSQTLPGHFPFRKPTVWPMTVQRRPTHHALVSHLVTCFSRLLKWFTNFFTCVILFYSIQIYLVVGESIIFAATFKLKIKKVKFKSYSS